MSDDARQSLTPLRLLVGLAAVLLLANLGVLGWLHSLPRADLPREPVYDLGPGEQPVPVEPG